MDLAGLQRLPLPSVDRQGESNVRVNKKKGDLAGPLFNWNDCCLWDYFVPACPQTSPQEPLKAPLA